jgi:3-oxoadipate enol-lactonase
MSLVTIGGRVIHVEDLGLRTAPAVLLLHALGANSGMWATQLGVLTGHFRVLAFDLPGHGQSAPLAGGDAEEFSIADLAATGVGVLDACGVQRAAWLGLSIGGMSSLWAASHHPERVSALLACNSSPGPAPREVWQQRIDAARSAGMAPVVEPTLERWLTPAFRAAHPGEVQRIRAMLLATDARAYAACCAAIREQDQRAHLPRVTAPTLVIAGSEDTATPPALSTVIHAAIAGSQLQVLPAAHLSNVESSTQFNALVVPFLERHAQH